MANYVSNKVICSKKFFDKYFVDPYSLGTESYEYCKEHKYISFNKLFEVKNVNEYYDWYDNCDIQCDSLADDTVWHYEPKNNDWIVWDYDDLITKYKNNYPH